MDFENEKQQPIFFLLYSSLKGPLVPNCHQSSTQSCSERQLDGGSSVTQVGAAAGPGDGVLNSQDGSIIVYAVGIFYTASFMDIQQVGTKL